jgi:hypothetical protein
MPVDRSFLAGGTVILILAIAIVMVVVLWPLGRLPWP